MFDNTNPYELKEVVKEGKTIYYAVFNDGSGNNVETEISYRVAVTLFKIFVKRERNLRRYDERHIEYINITESEIKERKASEDESIEELICKKSEKEKIHKAIDRLPHTQRRRLLLYYFEGYTLDEIPSIEGCSSHSIFVAIERAKEKIKNFKIGRMAVHNAGIPRNIVEKTLVRIAAENNISIKFIIGL